MRPYLAVIAIVSVGCATTSTLVPLETTEWASWPLTPPVPPPTPSPSSSPEPEPQPQRAEPSPRNRLVWKAAALVGLSTLRVAAPHLPDDCTGLVRAVYEDSGIELMGAGVRGDNGVTSMYRLAFERSALHTQLPAPGDLVFFKETYDRNRDGQHNDGLTHVGVVESVDGNGTVSFVHRVSGGVKRGKLSMRAPLDKRRNDYLRPANRGEAAMLTGELFVTYASAARLAGAKARSARR